MKKPLLFLMLAMFSVSLHAQTITSSTTLYQADIDDYSWPVTIGGGNISSPVVVTLGENITLNQFDQYFIIQSEYVTFDGGNKTVTITDLTDYLGLLQNGQNSINGYSFIAINNIRVLSSNTTVAYEGGWVGQAYFALNASDVIISNCSSDGVIRDFGGGIVGGYSSGQIINSHTSGVLTFASGGIFGPYSVGEAINCFSQGEIGDYSGGIMGYNSSGNASDCYSTGLIGTNAGGIFGYVCSGSGNRCYSTGAIYSSGGGIGGLNFSGTIENSYSTGDIGPYAGGIVGEYNTGTVTNCYSTGTIDINGGGGITGDNNSGVVTNCIFEGNAIWDDNNAIIALTGVDGSTWTDLDMVSTDIPYRLSSFNKVLYNPATESIPNNALINSPAGEFLTGQYSIVSINNDFPSLNPTVSINSTTGMLTFTSSGVGTFISKIAYADDDDGSYQINEYTLNIMSTLPVTWRSFTVIPRGNAALLQWSTATEQNARNYNVQHSINGSSWTTIGTVTATGNSSSVSNYSYLHANPVTGNNYYRIQQTDLDGKYSYSSIQTMNRAITGKSFSVVNTLVSNGILQVEVKKQVSLSLYSQDGKIVWQKEFKTGLQNIDCSAFSKGVYFLKGNDAVEKILIK